MHDSSRPEQGSHLDAGGSHPAEEVSSERPTSGDHTATPTTSGAEASRHRRLWSLGSMRLRLTLVAAAVAATIVSVTAVVETRSADLAEERAHRASAERAAAAEREAASRDLTRVPLPTPTTASPAPPSPSATTPSPRPTTRKPTPRARPTTPVAKKTTPPARPRPVAGLTQAQMDNAAVIVRVGQELGMSRRALVIAIATAMQESNLYNLASGVLPESMNHPNQGIGWDHDSVGLFQQRPSTGWGAVADLMRPAYAATKFYEALRQVPGWESLPLSVAAQSVQVSAFPDAYAQHEYRATEIVNALI